MKTEQELFWDADRFAVVTDNTKPAMKWAIKELTKLGKDVYAVDISKDPAKGTLQNVSELPEGIERAIIGVTTTQPADVMDALKAQGINNVWIHWMTETPEVKEKCGESQIHCISGKCPMMYLGHGLSI
ncbi:MAG: CoA-binding protein [Methanosarcinales archaeon]|nr:CoA-binding protein [Methanosarcinales archaeon]